MALESELELALALESELASVLVLEMEQALVLAPELELALVLVPEPELALVLEPDKSDRGQEQGKVWASGKALVQLAFPFPVKSWDLLRGM